MLDMNFSAEHNNTNRENVDTPSNATVPFRNTDTSATEQKISKTSNMDITPVLADETTNGSLGTHVDDEREEEGPKTTDLAHKEHPSRPKSDKQPQDVAAGTPSTAIPLTDKANRNDNEDTPMEENDTSNTPLTREDTQEELHHSPKRTKKLKTEKTVGHQHERSRSLLRRVPGKSGKS
jgi:hypothetical protein